MRVPRIFEEKPLPGVGSEIELGENGSGHVGRVLRMNPGEEIIVFGGTGTDFRAKIVSVSKKAVSVLLTDAEEIHSESPLKTHLGQVISRGDKMDFTIQKAVELGISEITPLFSSRCGVSLSGERLEKKIDQWRKIVISACEQCGRSVIPKLNDAMDLEEYLPLGDEDVKLNLHPRAEHGFAGISFDKNKCVRLLIGPEGGLSDEEIDAAAKCGYMPVRLGPRVLRTETAALVALSALQSCHGDLG